MAPWSDREQCRKDHSFCTQLSDFYEQNAQLRADLASMRSLIEAHEEVKAGLVQERDEALAEGAVLREWNERLQQNLEYRIPQPSAPLTAAHLARYRALEAVARLVEEDRFQCGSPGAHGPVVTHGRFFAIEHSPKQSDVCPICAALAALHAPDSEGRPDTWPEMGMEAAKCSNCGRWLQIVRPGKWQCECESETREGE